MEVSEMRAAVEAAWEWAQIRPAEPYEGCNQGRWVARLPLLPLSQTCFENEDEAVEAAYQFTLDRQEQVRQVDEEIAVQQMEIEERGFLMAAEIQCDSTPEGEWFVHMTHEIHAIERTIARLQAIRADLTRGMKTEGAA